MITGTCQTAAALEADREPPCLTCTERQGCLTYNAHRAVIEEPFHDLQLRERWGVQGPPYIRRQMVVTTLCSRKGEDVRFSLMQAGVRNLCGACANASACETRHRLDDIDLEAAGEGEIVESWVISCYVTSPQNLVKLRLPDKLYQISEPTAGK